ncbi:MAG: YcxB family protein [Proteobacteria bacterium]|nr:YcxB family protein [Pseudomonadota bacterium]
MRGPEPLYRFAYDSTFADYCALMKARRLLGPFGRHGRWLRYPFLAAIFFCTLWWLGGFARPFAAYLNWDVAKWLIGLLVFILAVDLFFDRVVGRWVYSRYAAADKRVEGTVDEDGLSWAVDAWSGRFAWSGVKNAVVTADHAFIFIGKLEAITLARRGMADADWQGLLDLLGRKLPRPPVAG